MKYKILGKTGVQVSEVALGTMTFGKEVSREEAKSIFYYSLDKGINLFDCADVYNKGLAEEILGELIQPVRKSLVISTKFGQNYGDTFNDGGASRRHLYLSVEASLRRLRTEWIDIYFVHRFDPQTPIEETLYGLSRLIDQGKILYIGLSNWAAWQIAKALGIALVKNLPGIACIQPMYNLLKRQAEVEILPLAMSENLGVISYSPIGAGVLTGKYPGPAIQSATQSDLIASQAGRLQEKPYYAARYGNPDYFSIAKCFASLAQTEGLSPAVLAIAWVMKHQAVTAPLIGARSLSQLQDSLQIIDFCLSAELYAKISALTPLPPLATDRLEEQINR